MRFLLFSDVHCNVGKCRSIAERAAEFDIVIGAGDFAIQRKGLEKSIDVLKVIETPTVLVPGNGESDDELRAACEGWSAAHVLHGNGCEINGVWFYGLGGGVPPTPFGAWSFDLEEETAASMLADCQSGGILIVHSPPQGAVDIDSGGVHRGSPVIRQVVETKRPKLVVCGHIHDSWEQQEQIGDSTIINAGPNGMIWTLEA